jgi:hypothetical protein
MHDDATELALDQAAEEAAEAKAVEQVKLVRELCEEKFAAAQGIHSQYANERAVDKAHAAAQTAEQCVSGIYVHHGLNHYVDQMVLISTRFEMIFNHGKSVVQLNT